MKGFYIICFDCSPIAAAAALIALPLSPYPFNLFILAVCTARTALLYSNCILSIKKACFPWLLWCWNGSRGAIRIHSAVCFSPPLFCANSRIPIYILAVELNYCKHPYGPARHNRLGGSCIMSVPPAGRLWKHTIVEGAVWSTVEWAPGFFAGMLEHLLNESLMSGIPLTVHGYVHTPGINPVYLHISDI